MSRLRRVHTSVSQTRPKSRNPPRKASKPPQGGLTLHGGARAGGGGGGVGRVIGRDTIRDARRYAARNETPTRESLRDGTPYSCTRMSRGAAAERSVAMGQAWEWLARLWSLTIQITVGELSMRPMYVVSKRSRPTTRVGEIYLAVSRTAVHAWYDTPSSRN